MVSTGNKILVVDDDEDDYFLFKDIIQDLPDVTWEVDWAPTERSAEEALAKSSYSMLFIDYRLGEFSGIDLMESLHGQGYNMPMIILTGKGDQTIAVQAMKRGALDYLVKTDLTPESLDRAVRYASERFRSESKFREQQERYRDLFEQSIEAIFICDHDFNIVNVNKAFKELFFDGENPPQSNFLSYFVNQADRDEWKEINRYAGKTKDFEVALIGPNEVVKVCSISSVAIGEMANESITYQGIIRDLTQVKKLEMELRRTEKLNLTGRMARVIAHEVRNPLTNINLAIEQLGEELKGDEMKGLYVDIISRNSSRINELISELLNSSKPFEISLAPANIKEVLEEAVTLCKDRMDLMGVRLEMDIHKEQISWKVDAEKLKLAFLNLMTNALEAMENIPQPGMKISCFDHGGGLKISIEDNGKGMDEETKNRLFDAFFTAKSGGMGLGMTTVQNILNAHRAKIEIQSAVGKGTRFDIQFPSMEPE